MTALSAIAATDEAQIVAHSEARPFPPALDTPKARSLLAKAQAAGWLDDTLKPRCSKTMAALIASEMGRILHLDPRWPPFEELWQMKRLSRTYSDATYQVRTNQRIDDIRNALR